MDKIKKQHGKSHAAFFCLLKSHEHALKIS